MPNKPEPYLVAIQDHFGTWAYANRLEYDSVTGADRPRSPVMGMIAMLPKYTDPVEREQYKAGQPVGRELYNRHQARLRAFKKQLLLSYPQQVELKEVDSE